MGEREGKGGREGKGERGREREMIKGVVMYVATYRYRIAGNFRWVQIFGCFGSRQYRIKIKTSEI